MPTWPFFTQRRREEPKDMMDRSELDSLLELTMRRRRRAGDGSSAPVPREPEWDEDMLKPSPRCLRRVEPFYL